MTEKRLPVADPHFAENLDWNLLRVFHEICKAGGISNAARVTSRKQPALSMALRRLEGRLGVRLCQRGPGGFVLTQAGELLAEHCETVFASVSAIPLQLANTAAELRGRVRIEMISNLVDDKIDDALSGFHQAHPAVEVFLTVSTWEAVPRSVLRNEVDIGLAPARAILPNLRYEALFTEVYRPCCGRDHPLFGQSITNPKDLAAHGLIHTGADEPEQLTAFRQKYGIGQRFAGMAERIEEARRLTVLGVGVCFLPENLIRNDVESGILHPLLDGADIPSSDIFLITNPDTKPHPARDKLLSFFRSAG